MWDYKEGRLLSTVDRWMDGTKNQTHSYCVSNTDSVYIRTGLSSSSIHIYMLMHSVLTRGALGEVVNLTKPMIESGLGGLDRPCASLITLCSSHLGHFYGQKLPKNGHIWVHRP